MYLIGALHNRPHHAAPPPTANRIYDGTNDKIYSYHRYRWHAMVIVPENILPKLHKYHHKSAPNNDTPPKNKMTFSLSASLLPLTKTFVAPGDAKHAL